MTDTENSSPHPKPNPDPEAWKTSQYPAGDHHPLVRCKKSGSPPPTDPPYSILLCGHQPYQVLRVSQETHLHLELGAHQVPMMPPDRHGRPAIYSLDYICLPVLSLTLPVKCLNGHGWGSVWGGWCIGGYSKCSVYVFLFPSIFFIFDKLDKG